MREAFLALVLLTWGTAAAALLLRNLVRAVLLFTASWAGIAGFYLWAGSEFAAFAQGLVYVGAVSMIALFAVLLTRAAHPGDATAGPAREPLPAGTTARVVAGLAAAGLTAALLGGAILSTPLATAPARAAATGLAAAGASGSPGLTVRALGTAMLLGQPVALLAVGAILTVALLGAVTIASADKPGPGDAP